MATYSIKPGDTLWQIGRDHRVHWELIWNADQNRSLRDKYKKPERIQVNADEKWFIPEPGGIEQPVAKNSDAVCTVRQPILASEIPRFDCHCHLHADSVFRMRLGCTRIPTEAERAMICNLESANVRTLLNAQRPTAVVPLMLDLSVSPLWIAPGIESNTRIPDLVGWWRSRSMHYRPKRTGEQVDFDPSDMYPPETYLTLDDDFARWRNAVSQLSRELPGQIFPFAPFDPRRPNSLQLAQECIANHGFVGLKIYTRTGWRLSGNEALTGNAETGQRLDGRVKEMFSWATENNIPVLNHSSPGGWPPDEFIAFPNGLPDSTNAGVALIQWENSWWLRNNNSAGDQRGIGGSEPRFNSCGRLRMAVLLALRQGTTKKNKFSVNWAAGLLGSVAPEEMNSSDRNVWYSLAQNYANSYSADLDDYKQFTVTPQSEAVPAGVKYCLAHCGSDAIFADDKTLLESLTADSRNSIAQYAAVHQQSNWLNLNTILSFMRSHENAFLDLSYFTGVRDHADRVKIYTKLLEVLIDAKLADRVLFGTDWPMAWAAEQIRLNDSWNVVREATNTRNIGKKWASCWNDITRENPLRFLGLQNDNGTVRRLATFWGMESYKRTWLFACLTEVDAESEQRRESIQPLILDKLMPTESGSDVDSVASKSVALDSVNASFSISNNGASSIPEQPIPLGDIALLNTFSDGTKGTAGGAIGSHLALRGQIAVRLQGTDFFLSYRNHPMDPFKGNSTSSLILTQKQTLVRNSKGKIQVKAMRLDCDRVKPSVLKGKGLEHLVDQPLPHWNRSPGLARVKGLLQTNHDLASGAAETLKTVTVFKYMGRILFVLGAAASAYEIYHAENKKREFSIQAGGWAAAGIAGATGCDLVGKAGAVVGAAFGGAGAIPGAFIGCIGGGAVFGGIGWWGGSTVARVVYDWMFEPLEQEEYWLLEDTTPEAIE